MKNSIFTLGLVALLSLTAVSCSTDDSALTQDAQAADNVIIVDNGDKDLPKVPQKP